MHVPFDTHANVLFCINKCNNKLVMNDLNYQCMINAPCKIYIQMKQQAFEALHVDLTKSVLFLIINR